MNIRLLRKIKKAILADPLRLDMGNWFNTTDRIAPCGSTACIAGWAVALNYQSRSKVKWATAVHNKAGWSAEYEASILLGIERTDTDPLFYVEYWPLKFRNAYLEADRDLADLDYDSVARRPVDQRKARKLRRQMARVTADRIENYIETKGKA